MQSSWLPWLLMVTMLGGCLALEDIFEEEFEPQDDILPETTIDEILEINRGTEEDLLEADIRIEDVPEDIKNQYNSLRTEPMKDSTSEEKVTLRRELRRQMEYLWVDRVVPYEIMPPLDKDRYLIERAMQTISELSCIKFTLHTDQRNWIRFEDLGGCFSGIGRSFWRAGHQSISLGPRCLVQGTILHEILHSLGVWHEQSRLDRNDYVEILWENIQEGEENNFEQHTLQEMTSFNSQYDANSLMHYGTHSFSKNGKPTILSLRNKDMKLGSDTLSPEDVIQLNLLYRCEDEGNIYTTWSEWSPCSPKTQCIRTKQRFCSHANKNKCPKANQFGVQNEVETCTFDVCYKPTDGHWNKWGEWDACNAPCDTGVSTRTRVCDDPPPAYGGRECEGRNLDTRSCLVKPCGLGPDDCLFDGQGFCFWTDKSPDAYQWTRKKGATGSGNTGPNQDHSSGKGNYLYTEASAPASTGMVATLVSKTFQPVNSRCLQFYYHMKGLSIGWMRVILRQFLNTGGDTAGDFTLWEKHGEQGNSWQKARITFSSPQPYQIIFESTRGNSYLGDIGLDDVTFPCDGPATTTTTTKKKRPTTAKPTTTPVTLPPTRAPKISNPGLLSSLCGIPLEPVGCFVERPANPLLSTLLDNHRSRQSQKFHGVMLDWGDFKGSLEKLLCDCAVRARQQNLRYIGLQYYAECWGGDSGYGKYGPSKSCRDGNYKQCSYVNKQEVCVGEKATNYVYRLL